MDDVRVVGGRGRNIKGSRERYVGVKAAGCADIGRLNRRGNMRSMNGIMVTRRVGVCGMLYFDEQDTGAGMNGGPTTAGPTAARPRKSVSEIRNMAVYVTTVEGVLNAQRRFNVVGVRVIKGGALYRDGTLPPIETVGM